MPNGFHGSKERWDNLAASLLAVDALVDEFAAGHQLRVERDYHSWPSRSLLWSSEIERKVEISLDNSTERRTYSVSAVAWADENGARYWRQEVVQGSIPGEDLATQLPHLLVAAYERARSWQRSDLEFATRLA